MQTDDVIFEPLPEYEVGRPIGRWTVRWADQLRARPGEWARLPLSRKRHSGKLDGIEQTERRVNGELRVYGRYVGLNGEHA